MFTKSQHLTSACLIGAGALLWVFGGRSLVNNDDLNVPLNPLGINRSPYGEVFAMAIQGPIDTIYHHGANTQAADSAADARGELISMAESAPPSTDENLQARFRSFLTHLDEASAARTNPRPASRAHDLFIRRKVEDKLKFAYHLDPSHYGNYNSYHFFLTEPAMGTRPELTPGAAKLAEETIRYCLREPNDPRPALTAAAAATNLLHLMFADQQQEQPRFNISHMKEALAVLDQCLARHFALAENWQDKGNLSPMRLIELETRVSFVTKIRDAADSAIKRLESARPSAQVSN